MQRERERERGVAWGDESEGSGSPLRRALSQGECPYPERGGQEGEVLGGPDSPGEGESAEKGAEEETERDSALCSLAQKSSSS